MAALCILVLVSWQHSWGSFGFGSSFCSLKKRPGVSPQEHSSFCRRTNLTISVLRKDADSVMLEAGSHPSSNS